MPTPEDFDAQFQRALGTPGPAEGPPAPSSFDTLFQQEFAQAGVTPPPPASDPASGDQSGPGFFSRSILTPALNIATAAVKGFQSPFEAAPPQEAADQTVQSLGAPSPETAPVSHLLAQSMGALSYIAQGGLDALRGFEEGAFSGFTQSMIEAGVSPDTAKYTSDSWREFLDVSLLGTGTEAPSVPGATVKAFRTVTGAETAERAYQTTRAAKKQVAGEYAINRAREEARNAAASQGEAAPGQDIAAAQVDTAVGRVQDASLEAQAVPYLRQPDQILTDNPVFTQATLTSPRMQQTVDFAREVLKSRGIDATALSNDRVFLDVLGLIRSEGLAPSGFMADLHAAGLTEGDFFSLFGTTASESGRSLQALSTFWKGMREDALLGTPEEQGAAADFLDQAARFQRGQSALTSDVVAEPFWRFGGRIFRKLLITLPVTQARNFIDAGLGRYVINAADRAVQGTLDRVFNPSGQVPPMNLLGEPAAMFDARGLLSSTVTDNGVAVNLPSPTNQLVDRILNTFPEQKHHLLSAIEVDLAAARAELPTATWRDKFEAFVDRNMLGLARGQEEVVRRAVFATELDRQLRMRGVDGMEGLVDLNQIPAGMDDAMANSIQKALETTYALPPGGQPGITAALFRHIQGLVNATPGAPLIEPFPGFLYNAVRLVQKFTPTGGLRLILPTNRGKIAAGDFDTLSREIVGSGALALAFMIRRGQTPLRPGPRWDEIERDDGTVVSLAPFNSFAPFLFLADLADRIDQGRIQPNAELFQEIQRGLVGSSTQAQFGTDATQAAVKTLLEIHQPGDLDNLTDFGAGLVGGFARPLQLIHDFGAEVDEAYRIQRETRGQGLFSSVMNMVAPGSLPERESPTQGGALMAPRFPIPGTLDPKTGQPLTVGAGVLSEITGLSARSARNPAERELARLGFEAEQISPGTGDKRLDALVARYQGPVFQQVGTALVQSPTYIALPVKTKMYVMQELIDASRQPALLAATQVAPAAMAQSRIQGLSQLRLQAIMAQIDKVVGPNGPKVMDVLDRLKAQAEQELRANGL